MALNYESASFRMLVGPLVVVIHVHGCLDNSQSVAPEYTAAVGRLLTTIGKALERIARRYQAGPEG